MPSQNTVAITPPQLEKENSVAHQHEDYANMQPAWTRARDVMAGEDAVKARGTVHLPQLIGMETSEYRAYKDRTLFFNATGRTADGLAGMIFRAPPTITKPKGGVVVPLLEAVLNDANMRGVNFDSYAKDVVEEILEVGRMGTLIDFEADNEKRAYLAKYAAEQITNWRVARINGKMQLVMVVLQECVDTNQTMTGADATETVYTFNAKTVEQYRVLKLVPGAAVPGSKTVTMQCHVELWRKTTDQGKASDWEIVETSVMMRRGIPLPEIPFVFHGPKNALPDVDKLPLDDMIHCNLAHYRTSADYAHGLHFTALPTAWVSGFPKDTILKIGSATAWVTDIPGAQAGFLEFKGQGLKSVEAALDRFENMMAILGARLLEKKTRAAETAQAMEIRASGEGSVLMNIAISAGHSMTNVLKWVWWWNSTEENIEAIADDTILVKMNTDFISSKLTSDEIVALVKAWQARGISMDTFLHNMRQGEVLPPGVTIEDEKAKIETETPPPVAIPGGDKLPKPPAQGGGGGGGN